MYVCNMSDEICNEWIQWYEGHDHEVDMIHTTYEQELTQTQDDDVLIKQCTIVR